MKTLPLEITHEGYTYILKTRTEEEIRILKAENQELLETLNLIWNKAENTLKVWGRKL